MVARFFGFGRGHIRPASVALAVAVRIDVVARLFGFDRGHVFTASVALAVAVRIDVVARFFRFRSDSACKINTAEIFLRTAGLAVFRPIADKESDDALVVQFGAHFLFYGEEITLPS